MNQITLRKPFSVTDEPVVMKTSVWNLL